MPMLRPMLLACALAVPAVAQEAVTLTIAAVDNPDMIRMQRLSESFTAENPDIALEWRLMGEGELRQTVGTDIALGGGRFDVLTLGTYEVPIWGARGWLVPLHDLPADRCAIQSHGVPSARLKSSGDLTHCQPASSDLLQAPKIAEAKRPR